MKEQLFVGLLAFACVGGIGRGHLIFRITRRLVSGYVSKIRTSFSAFLYNLTMSNQQQCELTILMPCLNEAETVAGCIADARRFIAEQGICAEVLIADNGSCDGSREVAVAAGARVIQVEEKGYGAALSAGIEAALGKFVIMADADGSYDFYAISPILNALRSGSQLVMGNRFKGGIASGAMPLLHRYLGNPVLSFVGRLFYGGPVGDFHCGLRGFRRESMLGLGLLAPGMEFASEMVVKSVINDFAVTEVPVKLRPDGRSRAPHLRTWRDGWRHLRLLMLFSPRWLFLIPGLLLLLIGGTLLLWLLFAPLSFQHVKLGVHSMIYSGAAVIIGFQMLLFAVFTRMLGMRYGWLPHSPVYERVFTFLALERMVLLALVMMLSGGFLSVGAVNEWANLSFGNLDPADMMRRVVPAVTLILLGSVTFLSAFFMEALRMESQGQSTMSKKPRIASHTVQL